MGEDPASAPPSAEADPDLGRRLYHAVGCVPCHGALASPAEVFADEELPGEIPDAEVIAPFLGPEAKWSARGLVSFLRDPVAIRPRGRMPSSDLSEAEAGAIAAYLLARWGEAEPPLDPESALAERGRKLYASKSCRSCHDPLGLTLSEPSRPSMEAVRSAPDAGCASAPVGRAPRYDLSDDERARLAEGLASIPDVVDAGAPIDEAATTFERLGCLACHEQDGIGGPPEPFRVYFTNTFEGEDLLDEGRLAPDLTGTAFRLTSEGTRRALVDGARARPYLDLRMPRFGAGNVEALVEQLPRREGIVADEDVEAPEATDEAIETGRRLLGRDQLACITCHVYRDRPPVTTPGPAFTSFAERIRYEWFRAYIQNPQRYKLGSRMPDFGTGGVSTLAEVYDGDLRRQGEAIWAYLSLGELAPPPEGVEPEEDRSDSKGR